LGAAESLPFKDAQFDSILHVGGINAFNDRRAALAEMVRVARPGARLVVVDETAKLIHKFRWFPGAGHMLRAYAERFEPPTNLLPESVTEVSADTIMDGGLYCLTFRKGSVTA
jgi:ubiquinone/menaquinone biosynthesis C-methylase UbiE